MLDDKEYIGCIENEPVEIRLSRARNPDTDPELLRQLSHDRFWFVRDLVASNCSTPEECLMELMEDPDFRIRGDAEKTLGTKQEQSKSALSQMINAASVTAQAGGFAIHSKYEPDRRN